MRVTLIYYTQTGKTRGVASELANHLHADLFEIECAAYSGPIGRLRKAWDILFRGRPPIEMPALLDARDLIVVGGPVWDGKAAPPVLAALDRVRRKSARVAVFVTCDGRSPMSSPETAVAEMVRGFGRPVLTTRIFRRDELRSSQRGAVIAGFVNELELVVRLSMPAQASADGRPERSVPSAEAAAG